MSHFHFELPQLLGPLVAVHLTHLALDGAVSILGGALFGVAVRVTTNPLLPFGFTPGEKEKKKEDQTSESVRELKAFSGDLGAFE